jgi:anti-sigma factor RsiW
VTDLRSPLTTEDEALLCALLDGELSADDEAVVLSRLEREPALAAALDELASALALTHRALADDAVPADVDFAGLAEAALASSSSPVPSSLAGAAVLASLVVDGAATSAQVEQLAGLVAESSAAADAAAVVVGTAEATRAVVAHDAVVKGVAGELAAAAARIQADVVLTERVWSLSTSAADGVLAATERDELLALAGGERGVVVEGALGAQLAGRHVGEALRAAAQSPAFAALAARAGASALQVVAADAARTAAAPVSATVAAPTTSWWSSALALVRGAFAWRAALPLAAGAAAVVAVVAVRAPSTPATTTATSTTTNSPQAVEQAFLEIVGPKVLGAAPVAAPVADSAPLLADNAAFVETLDATASTQVFETPDSHITVIWVADLGDDAAPEGQGT